MSDDDKIGIAPSEGWKSQVCPVCDKDCGVLFESNKIEWCCLVCFIKQED